MTTPPEIIRKVKQLDNDVGAIYEILIRVERTQQRHDNRLDEHTVKLDEHTAKLDEHTAKLDEHTAKLDEHTAKLDEHTAKLDTIIELLRQRP
ncbi:MAG: hypothetical protein ACRDRH_07500 [Pseudonocardia sp.]